MWLVWEGTDRNQQIFPSSKLCGHCHTYNSYVKQQDTWTCHSCGTKHQRNENAVLNLYGYSQYQKQSKDYVYIGNKNYHQLVNNPVIKKNLHENQVKKLNDMKNQILLSRQEDFVKSKACVEMQDLSVPKILQLISMRQEKITM